MNRLVKTLFSRGSKLFIAVLLTATIAPQILSITPASADTGGYPWPDATYVDANYDWGYSTCPGNDSGCMSIYGYNNGVKYGEADPWVYYLRNCTSYAAWKINQVFGVSNITGWGNASTWDGSQGHTQPYTVYPASGHTPQVGEIAQWGTEVAQGAGHVAYVYAVNNGIASLDDYNQGTPIVNGNPTWGVFWSGGTTASSSEGTPDHYIHIGTVTSPSSTTPNDFDADHHTDLLFLHKTGTNGANLYDYNEANSFSSPGLTQQFLNSSGWNWNQMQVATDDANSDGKSDLFMLHQTSDGGFNFYIFYAGSFTIGSPVANFPNSSGWSWTTTKLLTGDFDGDGKADLMLVTQTSDGGADIFIYNASNNFTGPGYVENLPGTSGWNWSQMKLATGDVNNDGVTDVLMLHQTSDSGANFYVLYGASGNFVPGSPVRNFAGTSGWSWAKMKMVSGDFDNDKHADMLMLHELSDNQSANLYVFKQSSGFTETSPVRSYQASSGWDWNKMKISAGDVNNDGYSDLFMLHKLGDGGANFYAFHGSSFPDVSYSANFPGSSGWAWDSMLAPLYVQ